jgi:hypothetical protein
MPSYRIVVHAKEIGGPNCPVASACALVREITEGSGDGDVLELAYALSVDEEAGIIAIVQSTVNTSIAIEPLLPARAVV